MVMWARAAVVGGVGWCTLCVCVCGVWSEVVTGAVCRGEGQGGAGRAVVVGWRGPGVREIISFFVTNFRI